MDLFDMFIDHFVLVHGEITRETDEGSFPHIMGEESVASNVLGVIQSFVFFNGPLDLGRDIFVLIGDSIVVLLRSLLQVRIVLMGTFRGSEVFDSPNPHFFFA